MKQVKIIKSHDFFLEEIDVPDVEFGKEDYLERISLLARAMGKKGLDCVVIYGDREHFANIEYFSGYDCRFEEGLLLVDKKGKCTIVVGNEGMGYSYQIPFELDRVLYQNFSLQGQPRDKVVPVRELMKSCGINQGTRVGVVGYKYMASDIDGDPDYIFDIPAYLLDALKDTAGAENVENFTKAVTGLPDGIRMTLRSAKEIAWAEAAGNKTASVVQRLLKNLREGISETELSLHGKADFSPLNVHPMINFGSRSISIGLKSPGSRRLKAGETCGLCYSVRGHLTSRVGVAAKDSSSYIPELSGSIEDFFMPHWKAVAAWYENVKVGACAGDVYKSVMDIVGDKKFGVVLNPGHNIGGDEWSNSAFYKDSKLQVRDGSHLQADIIASSSNPVMTSICEDGVVIAGKALRDELAKQYPEVWQRIQKRQEMIRTKIGINISDDILPLSNMNGAFFPFMLDTGYIFGLE